MKIKRGFLTAAVFVVFSGLAGHIAADAGQEKSLPPEPAQVIEKDTEVLARTHYKACNHIVDCTRDFTGMDREQFREAFKGRIKEFSNERVSALRTVYSYCPEHRMIKTDADGELKVMQFDADGEYYEVSSTGVFAKDLSRQNRQRADAGIMLSLLNTEEFVLELITQK